MFCIDLACKWLNLSMDYGRSDIREKQSQKKNCACDVIGGSLNQLGNSFLRVTPSAYIGQKWAYADQLRQLRNEGCGGLNQWLVRATSLLLRDSDGDQRTSDAKAFLCYGVMIWHGRIPKTFEHMLFDNIQQPKWLGGQSSACTFDWILRSSSMLCSYHAYCKNEPKFTWQWDNFIYRVP